MKSSSVTKAVPTIMRWVMLGVALVVSSGGETSIANDLVQRLSAIKADVSEEVSRHPAIDSKDFALEWRDFPPTLPSCSRLVTTALVFYPADLAVRPSRVTLKLECAGTPRWTRHIRAQITHRTETDALKAAVPKGARFDKSLVTERQKGGAPDLAAFEGRVARRDLRMGSELRLNDWEPITVISKGSRVSVTLSGPGFQLETEGEALGDAGLNDKVQIKLSNGTRVDGIVIGENRVVVERI